MKQERSAGAIIFYKDMERGKIRFLLLKYTNYWGFAKGLIENREGVEETVKREVKEETDLEIKIIPKFRYKQAWFYKQEGELIQKEAIFLLAEVTAEEAKDVKLSFEHDEFAWLEYENAIKKMKIKSNKEMLKAAYEFIKKHEKQRRLF